LVSVEGPVTLNATVPVYPPAGVTVMIDVPLLPCATVTEAAVSENDAVPLEEVETTIDNVVKDPACVLSPE
jgi:hypothetical protein